MSSRYAGPQEGTYIVNPHHMVVHKPRNANDEDLVDGMGDVSLALTQPTSMSYFLQRIRLAELCREFTDWANLASQPLETTDFDRIMEADGKLHTFIQEIPAFFSLDGDSLEKIAQTDVRRAPGIIIQRYILNSLVYAQRCKLHVPCLAQDPFDPSKSRSREICINSARHIIRTERLLEKEDLPFVLIRLKFSGVLYCVFMATMVLLLDICLNKDAESGEERKAEAADACSILQEARGQSVMAVRLLDSLTSVLRKHHVSLPGLDHVDGQTTATSGDGVIQTDTCTASEVQESDAGNQGSSDSQINEDIDTNFFDEIWQHLDGNLDFGALFSDLSAQFL